MPARLFLGFFLLVLCHTQAFAVDIAVCGESEGYGYYPKFGLIAESPNSGKWHEDKISNGGLTLTVNEAGTFDLILSDSTGRTSIKEMGGSFVLLDKEDNLLFFVASHKGQLQSYAFLRNPDGKAEVLWTQNRYAALVPKTAAFRASCSYFVL